MYKHAVLLAVAIATTLSVIPQPAALAEPEEGLIAHWALDETEGSFVGDSSGYGFDGTLYGAERVPGPLGMAVSLDGHDDDIWIPDRDSPPPIEFTSVATGTITLWFRYEDDQREAHPLFYFGEQSAQTGPGGSTRGGPGLVIEVGHPNNEKLYVTVFMSTSAPRWCFDTGFDLEPHRWYHVAVVVGVDFNTGYLDGVELVDRHYNFGSAANTEFFDDFVDANRLTLGSGLYKNQSIPFLDGMLDDVRIYDRALSGEEISALYSGSAPVNLPPQASDDQVTATPGAAISIPVLANDSDPDGDPLTVESIGQPSHGQASTDGTTVLYTSETDFEGTDSFEYTAADPSGATDTATVTVAVARDGGATELPSTPTNLSAVAVSTHVIQLAWTDTSSGPTQETGFEVQRGSRTLGERWTTIATTPADAEGYEDPDVIASTLYVYRVRAFNDLGSSLWSNRLRVTTAD